MNYIVKNGPFVKSNNDKHHIELTYLLTLIPFLIYRIIKNPINNSIILILNLLSTLIISIFIDYIKNKKVDIKNYINDVSYSIIISILIPINSIYMLIFITNILLVVISKFYSYINYKSLLLFISFIYFSISSDIPMLSSYNLYIFLLIYIIVLLILISKKTIKFRIALIFNLFIIINYLYKWNIDNNLYILLLSSIYVLPDFKSTPNTALIQFIYAIALGIIYIFIPFNYLFILVVLSGLLFKIIDRYYIYHLAK